MIGPAHIRQKACTLFTVSAGLLGLAFIAHADTLESERVRGFFCEAKSHSIAFLAFQAQGENEEMAANAVNKEIAKFSCAYYLPADAIYTGDHTVVDNGLVYKLQSYVFLPEKVERWTGSVLGSLQPSAHHKHDV